MLILEGADLVGKTTLAKKLLEHPWLKSAGYTYRHLSRLPPTFQRYGGHCMLAARRVVHDRFHMSDIVYRQVCNEDQYFTPETYRLVDGFLRGFGSLTVVIVCEDNDLIKSRLRDGEMYKPEQILHANHLYGQLLGQNKPYENWQADYDYVIWTNKTKPYPDDDDVRIIVEKYVARQEPISNRLGPYQPFANMYWRS